MELEDRLREAMARRDPPAGFRQRVLAQVARSETRERITPWRASLDRGRAWRLAGAAAGVFLALSGAWVYQQREHTIRGEAAKRQLLLAVRIAGTKLQRAHRQVLQMEEVDQ